MVVFGDFGNPAAGGPQGAPSVVQQVRAYWESLRIDGRLPLRQHIDPRGLASALEQVFLIEQVAPGHGRFRLAGNLFHDLLGMDVRGMPLTALFEPVSRERVKIGLQGVFDDAAALHLGMEAERSIGRPTLGARMTLLPLRGGEGEPMLALGVLACRGQVGRAPRRFSIGTIRTEILFPTQTATRILRRRTPETPAPADARAPRGTVLRLVHSRQDEPTGR
ncbi:MAG: PAS domain-containing protein [Paracoccaceae bacterium]